MIPLDSKMENGASVSDWLGTAGAAAKVVAADIDALRAGEPVRNDDPLAFIVARLEAALEEVQAVQAHVANVAAYGERT